jgi:hypothetical protein
MIWGRAPEGLASGFTHIRMTDSPEHKLFKYFANRLNYMIILLFYLVPSSF